MSKFCNAVACQSKISVQFASAVYKWFVFVEGKVAVPVQENIDKYCSTSTVGTSSYFFSPWFSDFKICCSNVFSLTNKCFVSDWLKSYAKFVKKICVQHIVRSRYQATLIDVHVSAICTNTVDSKIIRALEISRAKKTHN